jgi:hypothetical protein
MMAERNGRIDRQLVDRLGKLLQKAGLIPPGAGCKPPKPLKGWNGDIHFETKGGGSGVEDDYGNTATWSEDDSADVQIRGSRAFVTAKITYSDTNTRLDICHPPSYYSEQVEQSGSGRESFHVDRISVSIGEPFLRGTEAIKAVCEGQTVQDRTLPVPNDANPINGYSDGAGFGLPPGQGRRGVYAGTITRPWGKHSSNPFDIGPTCFAAQQDSDGRLIGTCTVTIRWHFFKQR